MGIQDKISGRVKQAAGDLAGDDSLRRQGVEDERKGEEKEALERRRQRVQSELDALDAQEKRVENLEARTDSDRLEREQSRAQLEDDARERGAHD